MSQNDYPETQDLFAAFDDIVVNAHASKRAVDRTRQKLTRLPSEPAVRAKRLRPRMLTTWRFATIAASLGLLVACSVLWNSGNALYAQVQEQLKRMKTITCELEYDALPADMDAPSRLFYKGGLTREEFAGGSYLIVRKEKDQTVRMTVDPNKKTAKLVYGFADNRMSNPVEFLLSLNDSNNTSPVAARQIDGQKCPGFLVKQNADKEKPQQKWRVWVHPETQLPVFCQNTVKLKSGATHTVRIWNFGYDAPLKDSLFSVSPPKHFAVTKVGIPHHVLRRWAPEDVIVKLGIGIGRVRFGMSEDEVTERIGKPSEVRKTPVGDRWKYNDHGVSLVFRTETEGNAGLNRVLCDNQTLGAKAFAGKTEAGITIGSSYEAVKKAYGEPDFAKLRDGLGSVEYASRGLRMTIAESKVFRFTVKKPVK